MFNQANIIDVSEATFEQEVIQRSYEKTVVVDFWAAWCGPCRMLGPILERLAAEPDSNFILAKVDVDANQGLSMQFGVRGIPAVKAFRDGQVAGEFVGAQPEPRVRQFLEQVAPGEAVKGVEAAEKLITRRQWPQAEKAFRELLVDDPQNVDARWGLARTLLGQGQGSEAKRLLDDLNDSPALIMSVERVMPLADFLQAVEKWQNQEAEVTVIEAQYRQAGRLLARGKLAPALDGLLDVLRANKDYRGGQARAVILGIFEWLGDEDPVTQQYRREMALILF